MIMPWHIYQEAEEDGVAVLFYPFREQISISMPDGIGMDCNQTHTTDVESTAAAHELGHVCTGSFYNVHATIDHRQKHENRADRYAIQRYIDKQDLLARLDSGETLPQLADHYGFTEDFIRKAVCLYVHGNLDVKHYCPK